MNAGNCKYDSVTSRIIVVARIHCYGIMETNSLQIDKASPLPYLFDNTNALYCLIKIIIQRSHVPFPLQGEQFLVQLCKIKNKVSDHFPA